MKPNHGQKPEVYYMDTDNFIVNIKIKDTLADIAKYVETRVDISNYKLEGSLPRGNKWKRCWINERRIRWKNNDGVCRVKAKTIWLFNR